MPAGVRADCARRSDYIRSIVRIAFIYNMMRFTLEAPDDEVYRRSPRVATSRKACSTSAASPASRLSPQTIPSLKHYTVAELARCDGDAMARDDIAHDFATLAYLKRE